MRHKWDDDCHQVSSLSLLTLYKLKWRFHISTSFSVCVWFSPFPLSTYLTNLCNCMENNCSHCYSLLGMIEANHHQLNSALHNRHNSPSPSFKVNQTIYFLLHSTLYILHYIIQLINILAPIPPPSLSLSLSLSVHFIHSSLLFSLFFSFIRECFKICKMVHGEFPKRKHDK